MGHIYIGEKRVIWEGYGEVMWVEPYGEHTIRVRASASLRIDERLDWTLLEAPKSSATIYDDGDTVHITNGDIVATVDREGTVTFYDAKRRQLLRESWQDQRAGTVPLRRAREYSNRAGDSFEMDVYFDSKEGERFYGLGFEANDCFDLKGSVLDLVQKNSKCSVPFVYSSLGYGFIWNNPAIGRVELGNSYIRWHAESSRQLDYLVVAGTTPDEVMHRYTSLYGRAPELPEWAAGFWQCKLRYETQEELLDVAREYYRRGIPLSVIVIDFFHWTQQGDWKFDPEYWPDPKAMVKELREMGIEVMVSVWPTVDPRSENFAEMREHNYLLKAERGVSVFFMFQGPQTHVDVTHPGARSFLWDRIRKNYHDYGVRMFWLDEAEPEMRPYSYDNVRYYIGNGLEVSNAYPFHYAQAFYDGLKNTGEPDVVNLVRCVWLGSQRFGTVFWSGDIPSTFESLKVQIKAGLNFSMVGVPWWTTDIGGFFNGDPESDYFRELIVRWFQFGMYCPVFRLHGFRLPYDGMSASTDMDGIVSSGGPNEIWSFGDRAYGIIKQLIETRQKLMPYIMEQMKRATDYGTPVTRPVFYDFPSDEATYSLGDQYMFGPSLLVAPVIEQGNESREVYLPTGVDWVRVSDGTHYTGGSTHQIDAPLESVPVFRRADKPDPFLSGAT